MKIRACNTAQVAVLQHEWRSHECCNTATSAVLHASIFNTWPLILKYLYYLIFLFIPKNKVFSNTDPSSSIRNVHVFSNTANVKYWVLKNKIGFFLNMLEKLQAKIPSQTSREKFQAKYCKLKIASQNCKWIFPSENILVRISKQKFLMKLLKQNNGKFPY